MQSGYLLCIRLTLTAPRSADNIELEAKRYLTFPPFEGLKIRLSHTQEDGETSESTFEIRDVVFDCAEGMFIVEDIDDSIVETYRETGQCIEYGRELYKTYRDLGFVRVSSPAVAIGRENNE